MIKSRKNSYAIMFSICLFVVLLDKKEINENLRERE